MTCPSAEGNRNALLAFHFGEGDQRTTVETRTHVSTCPPCREYLASLDELTTALQAWPDERPPAGTSERVVAQAARTAQLPARRRARSPADVRTADALPLVGLLPVMAALVALIRMLAGRLPALSFWPTLEGWPVLETVLPFAAATVALLALGGLAALAAAPALMLEARRQET